MPSFVLMMLLLSTERFRCRRFKAGKVAADVPGTAMVLPGSQSGCIPDILKAESDVVLVGMASVVVSDNQSSM